MKIKVQRYNPEFAQENSFQEYEIFHENLTLLEALNVIKKEHDATLSYLSGCRSGVCGSCAMRVNETEELACSYKVSDGDVIEPLKNVPVLRDLIVDTERMLQFNTLAHAWGSENEANQKVSAEDAQKNELQSDCILCGSCFSACPVYAVNENFLGPFALTRVWRYVTDVRE